MRLTMRKNVLLAIVAIGSLLASGKAYAQDTEIVVQEDVVYGEITDCKDRYYSTSRDNWFIQLCAGINVPYVENFLDDGSKAGRHITAGYTAGFGKWFSPYIGWRMSFLGGAIHYDTQTYCKAKYVNANVDFMWDMFNSFNVNPKRVFSIVPYVGLGGTYVWDFSPRNGDHLNRHGAVKKNQWLLPVSAGIQLRFRLCRYVDFYAEGRAQFYGDNFNNYVGSRPVDINISAMGGFIFNIGGSDFKSYNPCDYLSYISDLNNQVNDLRGQVATTTAALAAAEAQLPCPEVIEEKAEIIETNTLMSTVRFQIDSDRISDEEMVNVYNIGQWMKSNPDQNVTIQGYADKNTGTSKYNMQLSKRRAQAVYDILVNKYGINPDRLSISALGSDTQPYETNNWNRIVIFTPEKQL